jgi:type VI secretion system protein ImpJ
VKRTGANPVAWLEGMFLRPQHLQQQAEYVGDRIHHQLRIVDPFHWGVRELVIDEDALSDRRIDIRALEIVLPDGLWIRYPEGATIEIRDFAPSSEPIDVWIALPLGRPGEPDAAHEDENKRAARYQIRTESLVDQHRGGQPASVDLLVPNLRVFLSGEDLDLEQHESLRIARITSTGQKARPFALATDFAPPMLALQACPWLAEELAAVLSLLEGRIRYLSGKATTVSHTDLPRVFMRYTLARLAPVLRQLLATGATAPYDVYLALVELASALGAFRRVERAEFPLYDHANPYPGFRRLIDEIKLDVEQTVPRRFREFPLNFEKSAYLTKDLSAELADLRNQFYIGIRSRLAKDELIEHVKQTAKVESAEWISIMIRDNLAGLPLEQLPGQPTEIEADSGFEFWRVEMRGKDSERKYKHIRDSGSLALSLGSLKDADVRLYVVTPAT